MARTARPLILCTALAGIALLTVSPVWAQTPQKKSAEKKTGIPASTITIAALNTVTGTEPASGYLRSLLDDKDAAKKLIAEGLPMAKEPQKLHYNASLILALSAAELKDLPATEAFLRNCINQAAKLQSVLKLSQSFGFLIDVYFENKKYDETAKLCQELINMKTDDGKDRSVLFAVTNPRTGEVDFIEQDSFATNERLIPFAFRQQVQAMAKQGKYEQAHKVLDNLLKQENDWQDRQLKGWLYREAGDFEKAVDAYQHLIEFIKKDNNLPAKQRELAVERVRYLLSSIYVDLKQVDKSAEVLQELLKAKPNDPGYNNDLGYIWADHDMNLDEAERLIRKALEEDRKRRKADPDDDDGKDNGAYLDSLGWVLYKKKDLKGAKKALVEALEDKNAQHIEIYDHLGDVLMALGETDGAIEAWRKGLEHVTDTRRDQERRKLVEEKLKKHSK